ncbi:ABC transporter substrate-binding protein [Rhizobium paknamense]|uniref:Branched-chain amino acid transport system substrate-binding protein n=1 Tax=Rhizobium paknamense TaxID=1206817 RepID=A0ABU0IEZ2_9HYPH|nr:ABC transporter substrate-binding protein [Rhizobium paknamense]MDQ0456813.1 branched-chain amino acid transport system substrate-binding protein [Rhizobium paknamense]
MTADHTIVAPKAPVSRRTVLKAAGSLAAGTLLTMPSLRSAKAAADTLKIGFVVPLSGIRAAFGVSTRHSIDAVMQHLKDGVTINGKTYAVEIIVKDNQSSPTRSLQIGNELILNDKPDILLVSDAEGGTAIANLADARRIPQISTGGPWQGWAFQRHYNPEKGFPFTFHFFWGADELGTAYAKMWDRLATNKKVGTLYADNDGGRAMSDPVHGFPPAFKAAGYDITDMGLFRVETDDFSTQIAAFKQAGVEIVAGNAYESHLATFWNQAVQAGFKPKICTIAGGLLFPSSVGNLGERGNGMSTEVWWTPEFPYKSSLTGQSAREIADAYTAATGNQWTQPLGYDHALLEVGIAALKASGNPKDKVAVREAIANLTLDTVVGRIDFKGSPLKNIGVSHIVGGQWQKVEGTKFPFDLKVVDNSTNPTVPAGGTLKPLVF